MMWLEGRSALVTGASRGIGQAIARALSEQGAFVYLAARDERGLMETRDLLSRDGAERSVVAVSDITRDGDVERLGQLVAETTGTLDILICNSGIAGPSAPVWSIDPNDWDQTFAVNVRGVFMCCRQFVPLMIPTGKGSIVVTGSMTGKRPLLNRAPYAASKTALIGFVRTLATDAAKHGIRANAVSPGFVAGDRMDWVVRRQAEAQGISVDEARTQIESASPMGRMVSPEEVAGVVSFLASDAASGITGQDVHVTAGTLMH